MGLGFLWDIGGQLFTRDFWSRVLTRPLEAVRQHPKLALTSGLIAGAAVATGGLALKAAPVVLGAGGALFTGAKAVAAPAAFAVRHPLLTYLAVSQADLPTEIVRAFGQRQRAAPAVTVAAAPVPVPAPTPPPPAPVTRAIPTQQLRRGPVAGQGQWQALFSW